MVFDQTKTEASLEYNFLLQAIGNGEVILQQPIKTGINSED
jgi:hypothetical protein